MTNDARAQQEAQMRADFQSRLKENLAQAKLIKGEILTNDKPVESKSEEC